MISEHLQPNTILSRFTGGVKTRLLTALKLSLVAIAIYPGITTAFNELTSAQQLIYDRSHLSNTRAGQTLTYQYAEKTTDSELKTDLVKLNIKLAHSDDKRDVALDYLTGSNRMPFPDFDNFRGNPTIIATLEHFAQTIGRETGGGILYFRNRIRDGLADESVTIDHQDEEWAGRKIKSTQLTFSPFLNDVYLAERPEYKLATITIKLSDDVPGSVIGITLESREKDLFYFSRGIELDQMTQ